MSLVCEVEGEMWAARWEGRTTWGLVGSGEGWACTQNVEKSLGLKPMVLPGPMPVLGA